MKIINKINKKRDLMNDVSIMCYYHMNKGSKFTCEVCDHPICEECCEVEKIEEKKGKVKEIIRHYLCKPCYYDLKVSEIKTGPRHRLRKILKCIILPIIILLTLYFIFIGIDSILFFPPDFYLWKLWMAFILIMIEIGFILTIIGAKLNTPKTINRLYIEKARFLSNINTLKKVHHEMHKDLYYQCPYCHAQIDENLTICNYCGMELEKTTR